MPPPTPPQQQRQGGGIPVAHARALIPASRMEFHIQRQWAAALFVLLQAWKVTDLFLVYNASYPEQYSGILAKWWFIDFIYFSALYIAKIPWLQFTLIKTLLLTFGMLWLDWTIFAMPAAGLTGVFIKTLWGDALGKQTSVSQGRLISVKDVKFNSSHILGRHTVHILPYGTAKLNPNDEVFCLPSPEIGKKDIHIPIILNNTVPRTVSISRHDFETGTTQVQNYSGKDIQRATEIGHAKEGVEYYYVKVRKSGVYKLDKIVAQDGVDVRLYNRHVYVFTCPHAQFKSVQETDYCTGEQETLEIEVMGVPPLNVEYKKKLGNNGHETKLRLNHIQPDEFESPLERLSNGLHSADPSFFQSINGNDFSWAAVQHLTIPLNLTFETADNQEFKLDRVTDGAGNVMDISNLNSQVFKVHRRPAVKFQCSQTTPVNLLIGSKSTSLPLAIQGSGPFHLEYNFTSSSDEKELTRKVKLVEPSISATSPGEYSLVSISDKYCSGEVLFPSSCQVVQPELPSVKLHATPIASECAGDSEIGMKFVAEFAGAPPYALNYVITKHTGRTKKVVETKREFIDRSRHIFSYLPASAGEYTYEFTTLDDHHYKKLPTEIAPIKQVVHPQPDAKFIPNSRRSVRTCLGEDLSVDVELRGTGPYVLSWTLGNQLYSDTVEGEKYTIKLPPFERAGHHVVSLVKIQDANDCVKDLESRDFTIDVRRDRPTAFFHQDEKFVRVVEVPEGASTTLPIKLTGEGPWTVTYRNVELGDRSRVTRRFSDPNAHVEVTSTGHYELLAVEDSICKGDVLPPQYLVKWLDKPTISIPQDQALELSPGVYERPAVCQGSSDAIDVQFTGLGPFYCSYKELRSPNGGSGRRDFQHFGQEELTPGMKRVRLPLKTREAGRYRYVFEKLSDQRYTEPFPVKNLLVEQMVYATPTAKFSSKSTSKKDRTLCVGETLDSTEMDPIMLEFTGVAPFSVELGVRHQSDLNGRIINLDNIMTKRYKLSLSEELITAGAYYIDILSVNDANNCGTRVEGSDDTKITVKALEIATIEPLLTCQDVCVGDNVEFSLSGMGPFTVQYLFNGKSETARSSTSKLSMIADKPGNITIVSVGDQRNKCRSFPKDISTYIHEVPSSYISGGKEVIENIHEGDMVQAVVDLVGEPPFDFEWRRSRLVWDSANQRHYKGEVLESHMVYGVEEHRYLINTSVEGIIEIASIKDKYCQYPK